MLKDAITGRDLKDMPHLKEFLELKKRMTDEEYLALYTHIRDQLDAIPVGGVISAGWVVPEQWGNTVYMPIYEKVCKKDEIAAGRYYGSVFRFVVIAHPSLWRCVKQPKRKNDPEGIEITMYWRATE